jgi:murein DD-endopeptidase MepM/ murein hydrolase activator NlpD
VHVTTKQPLGLHARVLRFFPDHEIYVRSGGKMRFLRISTGFQIKLVALAAVLFTVWLASTVVVVGMQIQTAQDRIELGAKQSAVSRSAGRVEAWQSNVAGLADRLEKRQQVLDQMVQRYFGAVAAPAAAAKPAAAPAKIGAVIPEAAPLARIEARQLAFADTLTMAAAMRAREAEKTIRRYGLNPGTMIPRAGMGGPFIPLRSAAPRTLKELSLARLATSLSQLDTMERAVLALPNSAPASPLTLSSGFGVRSDPFNGAAALHAGLDITGDRGQPILAAAAGRVITVGQQGGYGNLVVVDHGHGLQTRYGHLSGFDVRPGQMVARGQQIARMGSTGRSTGDHLHFEVRVSDRAVNPRPFLEANADVLKVQDSVKRRFDGR